jgi:hypothetical protein
MTGINWERWARAAGIAFVVLVVAAAIVAGEPPNVGDPAADVVSYYDADRGQILVSSFLFVAALVFLLWFAGSIANLLRESGEGRVAATLTASVTAFVAVQVVLTGVGAALAHSIARDADPSVVQALFTLSWVLDLLAALPAAGFALAAAVGLMRTRTIPAWLGWSGIGLAALFILRSTNWAREGFWSPTGEYLYVLMPLALLWVLATSIVLVRSLSEQAPSTGQVSATGS